MAFQHFFAFLTFAPWDFIGDVSQYPRDFWNGLVNTFCLWGILSETTDLHRSWNSPGNWIVTSANIGSNNDGPGSIRYQTKENINCRFTGLWLFKNVFVWSLKVEILVCIFSNVFLYKIQRQTWFRPDTKYKVPTICLTTLRVQLVIGVECPCEHIADLGVWYW